MFGVEMWNETNPLSDASVRYLRRGYFAATTFMDTQIGLVLDALDATGPTIASNTVTLLWSDRKNSIHLTPNPCSFVL